MLPTIVKAKSSEKEDDLAGKDASVAKKSKTTAEERAEELPLGNKEKPAADKEEEEKEEGILAGLLGGYDSADSNDDGDGDRKFSPKEHQNKTLPSAKDLLS